MIEPIKLYFDEVVHNGTHGKTSIGDKVLYNLNIIDPVKCHEFTDLLMDTDYGDATLFLPTGRFITIVTATMNNQRSIDMLTFDLMNNEAGAKAFFNEDPNFDTLMGVFYLIRERYKEDYDKFILFEGDIPAV